MTKSNYLKPKSHFLDTLKSDILSTKEQNSDHGCECCGFFNSQGQVQVTDERDQSTADLYLCSDCYVDVKYKRNDNLMNIYSVSQVTK